jgi:hypothetical protein
MRGTNADCERSSEKIGVLLDLLRILLADGRVDQGLIRKILPERNVFSADE